MTNKTKSNDFEIKINWNDQVTCNCGLATRKIRAPMFFQRDSVHVEYSLEPYCRSSKAGDSALARRTGARAQKGSPIVWFSEAVPDTHSYTYS